MTQKQSRAAKEQADGTVDGGATSSCPEGKIWDNTEEKCVPVEGEGSMATDAPPKVKADGPKVSESDDRDEDDEDADESQVSLKELRTVREKLDRILEMDDDEEEDEDDKKESSEASSDARSEKQRTVEYLRKKKLAELKAEIEANELKLKAQEQIIRKTDLSKKISNAKENVQPQFRTPEKSHDVAYENAVNGPVNWFMGVANGQDVPFAKQWQINKQGIFETYGGRQLQYIGEGFREIRKAIPEEYRHATTATEAIGGPPTNDFMRIMSEQVLVLPNGKVVTPVRQFCEVKVLPPGTKEAFFYDYGSVNFGAITEGSSIGDSTINVRSAGGATTPRGARVLINFSDIEESPIDLVTSNNRSFALESVNDESKEVLINAYNLDTGSAGDASNRKAKGGGTKDGRWINGKTGANLTTGAADDTLIASDTLSFKGLMRGKTIIRTEGLDTSNLILYTSAKGVEDVIQDPNLDSYLSFSKPEVITEGVIEKAAGVNIVVSSALAPLKTGGVAGGVRSVLFIPGVAFGLVTGRDLTMEAQRRNEIQAIHLTGTQKIAGFVKNVEATCRLSHA